MHHDFHALWKNHGFRTSTRKPIAHKSLIVSRLSALPLAANVAVCECQAHTGSTDPVSRGYAVAGTAAKSAALEFQSIPIREIMQPQWLLFTTLTNPLLIPDNSDNISSVITALEKIREPSITGYLISLALGEHTLTCMRALLYRWIGGVVGDLTHQYVKLATEPISLDLSPPPLIGSWISLQ